MKKIGFQLLCVLAMTMLLTAGAYAQTDKPPGCCPHSMVPNPGMGVQNSGGSRPHLVIAADGSKLLGMSRSRFLDRLASAFFPGREIQIVYSSITLRLAGEERARGISDSPAEFSSNQEGGLVAVQEKRFFQVPRSQLRAEELDAMNELFLTDGHFFLKITFVKGDRNRLND